MIEAAELKQWLTEKDETTRREFKLKYVLTGQGRSKYLDELAKDIIALTDTAGRSRDDFAYLVIGAGDELRSDGTRAAEDVRPSAYDRQFFLDTANARCHPPIPDLSYAEIEVGGNYYGVVEIPPSPHVHELSRDLDTPKGVWRRGSVLIRRGDGVGVASLQEALLMKEEKERWGRPTVSALARLEEYLTDPAKAAATRRLVIDEAKRLYSALNDPGFLRKDDDPMYAAIAERMTEYEELTGPFLELFATGCHGGGEWLRPLWAEALTIIAIPAERPGGAEALVRLRRYPALLLLYGGGVAAVAGNNYGNLAGLLRQTEVRSYGRNRGPSFGLAPGRIVSSQDERHLREKGHRMPFNSHLVNVLRKPLEGYAHGAERYMEHFVRFEYLYALASEADGNGLIVGSFTWESEQQKSYERYPGTRVWIVRETEDELDRLGTDWPPLRSGLFDGPLDRFRAFKSEVDQRVLREAANFFGR
jgi:hypothetical protein